MVKNPSRPQISVSMVLERLVGVEKKGASPLSVVTVRALEGEGDGIGVVLKGEGIILSYLKRSREQAVEEQAVEEQVVVTLSEAYGALSLLFNGSTVTKMRINRISHNEREIAREVRGDLGAILRLTRVFVRDLPLN